MPWLADPALPRPFPVRPPTLLPGFAAGARAYATYEDAKYDVYCSEWGCFAGGGFPVRAWENAWPTYVRRPTCAAPLGGGEAPCCEPPCALLPGPPYEAAPWLWD